MDRNGILTVDDDKLKNALENNFDEVVTLLVEMRIQQTLQRVFPVMLLKNLMICFQHQVL